MKYLFFLISLILFLILAAIFLYLQNNTLDITPYTIQSKTVNNTLKIVHLSDFHSKPFHKVLMHTATAKPDIIVITGDYINDRNKHKDAMLAFGKALLQIAPVYYITGNHERRLSSFETLMAELQTLGFTVLRNEIAQTVINDTPVAILGLDENQADFKDYKARRKGTFVYPDMRACFQALQTCDGFKIVLSHFPENFASITQLQYAQYDFDLQLSGHAHGGQFILPLIGPVYSPGQGLRPAYARGDYGTRPKLIVSRGIGNAEFPFRLFNHPEINVITVTAAKDR